MESDKLTLVGTQFQMLKKLAEGSFGELRLGMTLNTKELVAIKLEKLDAIPQLHKEKEYYDRLGEAAGIPKIHFFGNCAKFKCLVMELLGKSLEEVFDMCDRRFSLKTVLQIALQTLDRVAYMHSRGLVNRDIKPENFLLGRPGTAQEAVIYLIDFGQSCDYTHRDTGRHVSFKEKQSIQGTARYMSVNAHLGRTQSRRDDLEALGYMYIYFLKTKLPWQGTAAATPQEKNSMIVKIKRETKPEEIAEGIPPEFGFYLKYTRRLCFTESPDYEFLKNLFSTLFVNQDFEADDVYDWTPKLQGGGGASRHRRGRSFSK